MLKKIITDEEIKNAIGLTQEDIKGQQIHGLSKCEQIKLKTKEKSWLGWRTAPHRILSKYGVYTPYIFCISAVFLIKHDFVAKIQGNTEVICDKTQKKK